MAEKTSEKPIYLKLNDCPTCNFVEKIIKPKIESGEVEVLTDESPKLMEIAKEKQIYEFPTVIYKDKVCNFGGKYGDLHVKCEDGEDITKLVVPEKIPEDVFEK